MKNWYNSILASALVLMHGDNMPEAKNILSPPDFDKHIQSIEDQYLDYTIPYGLKGSGNYKIGGPGPLREIELQFFQKYVKANPQPNLETYKYDGMDVANIPPGMSLDDSIRRMTEKWWVDRYKWWETFLDALDDYIKKNTA
jgi:hypothetical protein